MALLSVADLIEYTVYTWREDVKATEEEERNLFVRNVLEAIGLDLSEVWPEISLSVNDKIRLRAFLKKYDVNIIENSGDFDIFVGNELVGKWFKPFCKLKTDPNELDKSKKIFIEMHIKYQSLFEDENSE